MCSAEFLTGAHKKLKNLDGENFYAKGPLHINFQHFCTFYECCKDALRRNNFFGKSLVGGENMGHRIRRGKENFWALRQGADVSFRVAFRGVGGVVFPPPT